MKYEFMQSHRREFAIEAMFRVLGVAPSGYYEWRQRPLSNRALEHALLLRPIRSSFTASQGVYGAPRVLLDPREAGETCGKHRLARLMRENGVRAQHDYRTRRWVLGKPAVLIPNLRKRQLTVTPPHTAWAPENTDIRTGQGWRYLAGVRDQFSRKVVGWAAGPTFHRELALDAVLTAVRERRQHRTLIHSDHGTQYGSDAWRGFCRAHHHGPSMSRTGNC